MASLVLQKAGFPSAPVTRFAPSPTGFLHCGHVLNALYVWGIAHGMGGKVILRMEDHDRQRCRPEYEAAILEDLSWLGFRPDAGLPEEFSRPGKCVFRQSDHPERYEAALGQLKQQGLVYACDCSRKRLAELAPAASDIEPCYPGFCRDRGLPLTGEVGLRIRLLEETLTFKDLLLGPIIQNPARQCGDLLAHDRHGNWTYQFAVVVDDWQEGINLVIRGQDILESTARQILLARLLGRTEPPRFLHHGLLLDETGRKLSKRFFSQSVSELREGGYSPEKLLGEVAAAGGLLAAPAPFSADEASQLFTWE